MIDEPIEEPDATPDNFAKIYGTILDSSIWEEPHHTVRVWITMLVMADPEGVVRASYSGLRRRAGVDMEELARALETLEGPDPDSRDGTDGIRVRKIKGGWFVINAKEYRDLRTKDQVAAARRAKAYRDRHKGNVTDVTDNGRHSDIHAEVDVEVEEDVETTTTPPQRAREEVKPYDELLGLLGARDLPYLLGRVESSGQPGYAWVAEIRALLQGMHGKPVLVETMQRAVRDYVAASPKQMTLKHFRAFVRSTEKEFEVSDNPSPTTRPLNNGNMLRAGEIINEVKKCRNPQFPTNATPEWRDKLNQQEVRAVNAIGVGRILGEDKPGIVLAQLAKMLGEVAQ